MRRFQPSDLAYMLTVAVVLGAIGCSSDESSKDQSAKEISEATEETYPIDPISGGTVTDAEAPRAIFLDVVYHFESEKNLATFRRDPEKYATVTCPVSGNPVPISMAKARGNYAGRTWYFNKKSDMMEFTSDPEKYATYRCPVCGGGGKIAKPTTITEEVNGFSLHFCCSHCLAAFHEKPDGFVADLVPEEGVLDSTGVIAPTE